MTSANRMKYDLVRTRRYWQGFVVEGAFYDLADDAYSQPAVCAVMVEVGEGEYIRLERVPQVVSAEAVLAAIARMDYVVSAALLEYLLPSSWATLALSARGRAIFKRLVGNPSALLTFVRGALTGIADLRRAALLLDQDAADFIRAVCAAPAFRLASDLLMSGDVSDAKDLLELLGAPTRYAFYEPGEQVLLFAYDGKLSGAVVIGSLGQMLD